MNNQIILQDMILIYDIVAVTKLLENETLKLNNVTIFSSILESCSRFNNNQLFHLFLANSRFNPAFSNNHSIRTAASYGLKDIVQILLNDKRVDPTAHNNSAVKFSNEMDYHQVTELLLSNNNVFNSLLKEKIENNSLFSKNHPLLNKMLLNKIMNKKINNF
jgi:hypothetical protein